MAESNAEVEVAGKPNWLVGILAAVAAGLVGAIIYAAVIAFTDEGNEIGYLAILIGFGAGFALLKLGRVSGIAAGVVGAIVGLVCWGFAVELGLSWWLSQQGYGSIFSNLGDLLPETVDFFKEYFKADAIGYLFALFAAGTGFITAAGLSRSKS